MITGIDHVVIGVHDLDAGIAAYERLLNRSIALRYERDGVATALIATANVAVELMAPVSDAPMAERLRRAIQERGEGLLSVAFAVSDIERIHRRIERVALVPDAISDGEAGALRWRRFRASTEAANGVRLFFIERETLLRDMSRSDVHALDHVVMHTNDMERAAALYGARLGLDMRLDRHVGDRRLMFFRCGDLIVEVAHASEPAHRLWGLSWRINDAAATQARLASEGVNVTAVRDGFKPGTRVFSVRDNTCGVPTLMLQPSPNRD